jgi:hypothetical protein
MKPKNDLRLLLYTFLIGIGLPLIVALAIYLLSSKPNHITNASVIGSSKLVSSVPVNPVIIGNDSSKTNNDDRSRNDKVKQPNNLEVHHYNYEGMIGKPWTFYDVVNDEIVSIPATSKHLTNAFINWDKFTKSIRDIDINAYTDSATITITDTMGNRHYRLKKAEPQKYLLVNGSSKMLLVTRTSLVCELYFIFGNDAASVSNMDWEVEK